MGVPIFTMSLEDALKALIAECPSARLAYNTGYAAKPGTGPEGETCKTCQHCSNQGTYNRSFYKCNLMKAGWTHSVKTDIKLKSPACAKWELAEMFRKLRERDT